MPNYAVTVEKFQGGTSGKPAGPTPTTWFAVGAVAMLVGEVASSPSWPMLALGALAAAGVALRSWGRGGRLGFGLTISVSLLALLLGIAAGRGWSVAHRPEAAIEAAVRDAVRERDRLLSTSVAGARQVARYALERAGRLPPGRVPDLDDLLGNSEVELGVVVQGGDTVIAVGGSQRTTPLRDAARAGVVATPFLKSLIVMESRGGRTAQVSILLDASAALPDVGPSLASRSGEVRWDWKEFSAPSHYQAVEAATRAVTASMKPRPPSALQLMNARARAARWMAWIGILGVAIIAFSPGAPALARLGAAVLPLWVLDRAGLLRGSGWGGADLRPLVVGLLLMVVAVALWRRPSRRDRLGLVAATILLAMAPFLALAAAARLTPTVDLTSLVGWFEWQAILALGTAAYLLLASAPLRGPARPDPTGRWAWLAMAAAVAIGGIGIVAWRPPLTGGGMSWPGWYLLLWLVPIALLVPVSATRARRMATMVVAIVLAVLAAWGASLEQRIAAARHDVAGLAAPLDSTSTQPLDLLASAIQERHAVTLPRLYEVWAASAVHDAERPTQLAIWSDTTVSAWAALDSLAVSWDDLRRAVGARGSDPTILALARGVGWHQLLLVPLTPDTTVTVVVGPSSRLVHPTRFGRLVGWRSPADPGYQLTSRPAGSGSVSVPFHRQERFVRADQVLTVGSGAQMVQSTILMSTPQPFLVRASLTVLLDLLLILLVWGGGNHILGAREVERGGVFRRSYQRTVVTALIAFFVVPAAFFTLWAALRLRQEVSRTRVADAGRALTTLADDPALTPDLLRDPSAVELALLADRAGAEFGVYRHGLLSSGSLSLIADLGVLSPVLDPTTLVGGGREATTLARAMPGSDVRLSAERIDPEVTLATVVPGADVQLARNQVDLALLLLLASLGGTFAAFLVARATARALGQPIEALRQRALAIGRREPRPPLRYPPAEFEPVFDAIEQMERDLALSEARLEEESARAARVVAWSEMARQVAHEIKNPLTPMRLGLQHLRRLGRDHQSDLPGQVEATVERLLVEIGRLDRIARSFARFGTAQAEHHEPITVVDLPAVAAEVAELFRLGGESALVQLSGVSSAMVRARKEELIQVLLNLVENARHAGATEIRLVVGAEALRVEDNGRGIAPEQLTHIFEPTFSTTTSGTGLGLAIVRRLVEGWGGSIAVVSTPGVGTVFTLDFSPGSTGEP